VGSVESPYLWVAALENRGDLALLVWEGGTNVSSEVSSSMGDIGWDFWREVVCVLGSKKLVRDPAPVSS
jgi:hypothetical protein